MSPVATDDGDKVALLLLVGCAAATEEIDNEVVQLLIVGLGKTETFDNQPALLGAVGCLAAPGDITVLLLSYIHM